MHLDPPLAQHLLGEAGELGVQPGQQRVLGFDEHPAEIARHDGRIASHRIPRQRFQLRQGFDAGIAAADERERQVVAPLLVVSETLGHVELMQHAIAEPDRIGQRLEANGVVGQTGNGQRGGDRAG